MGPGSIMRGNIMVRKKVLTTAAARSLPARSLARSLRTYFVLGPEPQELPPGMQPLSAHFHK